ncbi:MAG: outer membrane protein assembly factor BamD [Sphingomicrobium sp.]
MVKFPRLVLLLLGAAVLVPLAGCAGRGSKGDLSYVARDVSTLYAAAKRAMDLGDYEMAAKLFDEVERQHPYSVWARRAQLMSAFNYYVAKKYPEAISSAQRFVTIHPGNADAPYAQYLIAMSYFEQMEDVSRDQSTTQSAADAFGELIRRYPESRYADDGRVKLAQINDHLAGKEMEIGRFYQRSENWLASTYRFRNVVDKYHSTTHSAEALERLVESYLSLGLPEEAERTAAVLGANYADTFWYRQALRLLIRHRAKLGLPNEVGVTAVASDVRSSRPGAASYPQRPAAPEPKPQ